MASTRRSNIEVFFRVLGAEKTRKAFEDLGRAGIDATRRLGSIGTGLGALLASVGRQAIGLSKTLGLIGAAGLGALAKGIKDTTDSSAELTSIVLALRSINGEIGEASGQPLFRASAKGGLEDVNAGGARQTASDLAFVQKVADDAGKSIKDLAGQYVQLQASASKVGVPLADVRDLFKGVSDAANVLGIDSERTSRAFVALTQIASKGKVAAEELTGQLAEALPGSVALAAKAYGMSVRQFLDAVGTGQVSSAQFIARLGKALNEEYAGSAKAAANTTRVAMGRLKNAFFLGKVSIGNGALDQEFRRIIVAATDLLKLLTNNGAFSRFGADLAAAIAPLADRFEAAVNGGFDFERILKFVAGTAKVLVGAFINLVTAAARVATGIGNLKRVFDGYGVKVPSITGVIVKLAEAFLRITKAIADNEFTGNGFLDFFVSLYSLLEVCVFAIGRLVAPKVGPGVKSLEQSFASMAHWINQAAAAIDTLSTGKINSGLDDTGEGILVFLIQAIDKVRQLIASIKLAWALLSGKGAPEGADLSTQRMFASRDALGDLVGGRENEAKFNDKGEQLYDPEQFGTLFKLRDIVTNLVNFIYDNRGALGAIFDGAADAIKGVVMVLDELSKTLDPIAKALGFENINVAIGYAAGLLFVFGRVAAVVSLLRKGILAVVGGVQVLASALGLSTPQFLLIALIVAGIAFIVGKIVSNWRLLKDEVGNIITLIGAGLTAVLAKVIRGLAGLLSYIPLVGGKIERSLNGFADKLDEGVDAARKNVYYTSLERTSQRQVENGGKDPYSDAGPNGFGAFSFLGDGPVAQLLGGLGSKQDEANATLKEIAAQNAAAIASGSEDQVRAAVRAEIAAAQSGQLQPANIALGENGSIIRMYGRPEDVATFDQFAAQAARNRPGQRPAWAG